MKLVEMAHSWTQGFDFIRMFFGYLFPSLSHISRISLLHHVTSSLSLHPTLLAYASHREWFRHLCEIVPVVYDIVILGMKKKKKEKKQEKKWKEIIKERKKNENKKRKERKQRK